MENTLIRYKSMFLAIALGILMSFAAFGVIRFYEQQQLQERFNSTFSDKTTGLTQAIIALEKVLVATQQMMTINPNLSGQQFAQLVNEKLLFGTSIKGVQWAPAVLSQQKEEFENAIRQEGIFDFLIRSMDSKQNCQSQSNVITPITYAEPSEHLGHELGLDLSSNCQIQQSMHLAATQKTIVGHPYQSDSGEIAVRLILPVYSNVKLVGYVVGVVMLNELVDSLWGELTQSPDYQLTIYTDVNKQQKVYDSNWLNECEADHCQQLDYVFTNSADIPFADQLLYTSFKQLKVRGNENYYAYLAAFLVLLVTATLSYYLYNSINRMQWANKLVEERTASLKFQANHDQLTSLLNKTSLFSYLEKLLSNPDSKKFKPFSILFIDLDHFKKINDTMGHLVGDQILQLVSERLQTNSRSKDLLFRFGGDEFVIILHGLVTESQVVTVAERYLTELKAPYQVQGHSYQIGASIGASIIENKGASSEDILRNADIAMYNAKDLGRGQVVFFRHQMYDQVMSQHRLEFDLALALEQDDFELYYQPIFGSEMKLVGFEALARWHHANRGIIMPLDFIPLLEGSNMIKAFGELIVEKAIAELSRLYLSHKANCPYVSINISPLQLQDSDIVTKVRQCIEFYQLPASLLAIELTESALIENHKVVKQHLVQLSELGVKIYLDDFGTGYSSLSLLQHFPIDTLKVDRSFVLALNDETKEAENLVKAIISMAKALNMSVIAEGIEFQDIMSKLVEYGCSGFQGYYFAKPIPSSDVKKYIASLDRRNTDLLPPNTSHTQRVLC